MAGKQPTEKSTRIPCNGCGGSGQISFFRGVSRFVMDWDDCPDCLGTGYIEKPAIEPRANELNSDTEIPSDQ